MRIRLLGRTPPRRLALRVVAAVVIAAVLGCDRGGDGAHIVSQDENDIRVGRQTIRCGVPEASPETIAAIQQVVQTQRTLRALGAEPVKDQIIIPVAVHVIALNGSVGNLSDGAIAGQIAVLNERYAAAGTPFQFSVVSLDRAVDPVGAVMGPGSSEEVSVKSALHVGGPETLNLYFASPPDGTLGFATFPWDVGVNLALDGVVLAFQTVPNGEFPPYNLGVTAVHEVGHWLGLLHTFQGGCSTDNDLIADTPEEQAPAFGCAVGRNSCLFSGGDDPVHNYMDYSDDACLTEFTPHQLDRMVTLSAVYRGL